MQVRRAAHAAGIHPSRIRDAVILTWMSTASDQLPSPDSLPARNPAWGFVLAFLVLISSLVLVLAYWRNAQQRELRAAEADFVAETRQVADLLRQRLVLYELMSRGGVSLFASVERPSRQQWRDYVVGLDLREKFPALLGLGFAAYVTSHQLSELQVSLRDAGHARFEVRPHGVRELYGPILYLEPATQENLDSIGYDMYSEPARRAAMASARDSGRTHLSGPVRLVQDGARPHIGLLMYSPVYLAGARPATLASRRSALRGWVYVPFRMQTFVEAALGSYGHEVGFDVRDVTGGAEQLLYRKERPGRAAGMPSAFANSLWLDVYGRRWRLDFHSASDVSVRRDMSALRNTLWAGLAVSFLLFGITLALARTQARAGRLAARMSESYRRSEMRFRSALQYSAIGKALLDQEGRIVEANPALARILGSSPEALAGTRFASHFDNADGDARQSRDIDAMEEGVHRTTRRLRRRDGDLRQLQLTFASVPGDIGQDIARLVQVDDVTERVRAEARIHALNRTLEARVAVRTRELTQANQELESFAYSVSHDLRAPLRSIDGFSRLLTERYADKIDDSGKDYLARIRNAAGRMGELIEALLKMSRLTRSELKMVELDLSRMATEVASDLRAADPQRSVLIEIEPGLRAYGDQVLVRNLLQNLLGNAWKFTAGKADARIRMGRNEQQEYFVRDNGAGFAQEYIDKLFRPFQRLHSQHEFAGHGIGLASVKRIVERHGGSIRAEGKPDEGAAFYFTLAPPTAEG